MIKELLLSLAVAAASGVSFVGSPKRVTTDASQIYGSYEFEFEMHHDDYMDFGWDNPFMVVNHQQIDIGDGWVACNDNNDYFGFSARGDLSGGQISIGLYATWKADNASVRTSIISVINESLGSSTYQDFSIIGPSNHSYGVDLQFSRSVPLGDATYSLSFTLNETHTVTKELYNCSINSTPTLPETFTATEAGGTYTIYAQANEDLAGSYGFNNSSLTLTGVTTSNFMLSNEIGSTGLYRGCSFSITLPANDITIRLEAFRPTYSIAATLNYCTASPSVETSYSGMYAEDYTFTAESGYAFNSLVTSWEFSANITAQDPVFSNRLYGSLYEKVTFRLVFSNGNCEFRITAAPFNLDSYSEGYDSGYSIGYDKGHADGLIAGDSYGVWNWLKQAARTTGEFFSIPLLPGFSIGALLTALAGLMIIWLFIKGFLFKS